VHFTRRCSLSGPKPAKRKTRQQRRRSRPFRVFTVNMKALGQFANVMSREVGALNGAIADLKERLEQIPGDPSAEDWKAARAVERRLKGFKTASNHMWLWMPVHMVTFVETYLQDLLADAAMFDPGLLEESAQSATYREVTGSRSVKRLAEFLRHRWARNWVDSGGPAYLTKRLQRMGASGFEEGLDVVLERMWGVRHVVVHRSGLATRDFIERHPIFDAEIGKPIIIPTIAAQAFRAAATHFVDTTDHFATKRWPGLIRTAVADDPVEEVQGSEL
jgi:hypothetical protein